MKTHKTHLYILIAGLIIMLFPGCGKQGMSVAVGNKYIQRLFVFTNDVWLTSAFTDGTGSYQIPVQSDEFMIQLMDGTRFSVDDYRPSETYKRCGPRETEPGVYEITYLPAGNTVTSAPEAITIRYLCKEYEPYLRKQVIVKTSGRQAIDRLEVERFQTGLSCSQGGKGEPVFIGERCFTGLEYPASETGYENGLVTLAHYPGYTRAQTGGTDGGLVSKTAVVGIAPDTIARKPFFSDYIDSIRIPARNMLHYNSWYDLRGREITPSRLLATFDGFRTNLLEPYGLIMDSFVPDDGYQEKNSLWVPNREAFTNGFTDIAHELETRGSRLGLWLPLNGYLLNVNWGVSQGFEQAEVGGEKKAYYDLAGPVYNKAIRAALKRVITEGSIAYMKHDFNFLQADNGQAYPHTARHGHEANVDAELELLDYERSIQKDIFLNVTSCLWHSPWWLMYADTIWMCAGDSGFDHSFPQFSAREWASSYRDAHLYNVCIKQNHLVPVSAYMTHGIIHGRYHSEGFKDETLREWADYVMLYYGRGVQLKELYITPELMTQPFWEALGTITYWAVKNTNILERSIMIGGDPHEGKAYGYMHWKDDNGILVARNPLMKEQVLEVPFDQEVGFRGTDGQPYHTRVIYPYVETRNQQLSSGTAFDVPIPGTSVIVMEIKPGKAPDSETLVPERLKEATAAFDTNRNVITVRVPVPDEDMPECSLRLIINGQLANPRMPVITVNNQPADIRAANGPDWSMRGIDLQPWQGSTVTVRISFQQGAGALFMPAVEVSAWWFADRKVAAPPLPENEILPFPLANGYRRQVLQLLPPTKVEPPVVKTALTKADLAGRKAVMLRMMSFGAEIDNNMISLNGIVITNLPKNSGVNDSWEEKTILLTPAQAATLGRTNTVQILNGGDYFKVKGIALAVQLKDGAWVRSSVEETPQTSIKSWSFAEGDAFIDKKSRLIELVFEEK